MAIIHTVDTDHGIHIDEAYIKIDSATVYIDRADILLNTYHSAQARLDGHQPIKIELVSMELPDSCISWGEIYTYVKTLPEFAGAIDV